MRGKSILLIQKVQFFLMKIALINQSLQKPNFQTVIFSKRNHGIEFCFAIDKRPYLI